MCNQTWAQGINPVKKHDFSAHELSQDAASAEVQTVTLWQ
jgi:hypothetical protein